MGQSKLWGCGPLALGLDSEVMTSWLCDFWHMLSLAGPCFFFFWRVGQCYLIDRVAIRIGKNSV